MQETAIFPESPDVDTVWCFCDKCNAEGDPNNSFVLPDDWASALKMAPGTVVQRGVFMGPFEDALKEGWEERDWGYMCPVCKREEAERGDGETEFLTKDEAVDTIGLVKKKYELPAHIFVFGKEVVPSTDYEFVVDPPEEVRRALPIAEPIA